MFWLLFVLLVCLFGQNVCQFVLIRFLEKRIEKLERKPYKEPVNAYDLSNRPKRRVNWRRTDA